MSYVLVLTFLLGVGTKDYIRFCPDAGCVIEALDHAHESTRLTRLRVFPKTVALANSQSVFPAMIDERYQ